MDLPPDQTGTFFNHSLFNSVFFMNFSSLHMKGTVDRQCMASSHGHVCGLHDGQSKIDSAWRVHRNTRVAFSMAQSEMSGCSLLALE